MADNNDKDRIIEKIKKLLALAQDKGATAGEAANAARQAEAMLRKYNVEMSDVIAKELNNPDNLSWGFVRSNMFKNNKAYIKKVQDWPQWVAVPCAELYDCHVSMRVVKNEGHVMAFFGYKTDVEVCCWVYEYLLDCIRKASLALTEGDALYAGATLRAYRVDFRKGMSMEIGQRLRQAVEHKRAQDQQTSSCTALVVMKRQAVEQKFGTFNYGTGAAGIKNTYAAAKGVEAGRKVNLNPNPIKGPKASDSNKLKG